MLAIWKQYGTWILSITRFSLGDSFGAAAATTTVVTVWLVQPVCLSFFFLYGIQKSLDEFLQFESYLEFCKLLWTFLIMWDMLLWGEMQF